MVLFLAAGLGGMVQRRFDFPALGSAIGGSIVAEAVGLISSIELFSKVFQLLILIVTFVYLCHRYWRWWKSGKVSQEDN